MKVIKKMPQCFIELIMYLIITLIVVFLGLSFYSYLNVIRSRALVFCFSNDCLININLLFPISIEFLKLALLMTPILAFCIACKTYLETTKNNIINLTINRERDFNTFMKESFTDKDYNNKRFYLAIYESPANGDFRVNRKTKKSIDDFLIFLKKKGKSFLMTTDFDNKNDIYRDELNKLCKIFFIELEVDKEISSLFEYEAELLKDLEYIFQVWVGHDFGFALVPREYARRS